jgi:hypothetical protein
MTPADILAELKKASATRSPALTMCAAIGRGEPITTFIKSPGDAIPMLEDALAAFDRAERAGARPADFASAGDGLAQLGALAIAEFDRAWLRAVHDEVIETMRRRLKAQLATLSTSKRWANRVTALTNRPMTHQDLEALRGPLERIHGAFDAGNFLGNLGQLVASLEPSALPSPAPEA